MEDTNYCVYLHRRRDNDAIIYVGEGRESRANKTSKSSCRNKRHCAILEETQIYYEIYKNNLTKQQAEELEEILITELTDAGVDITNRNKTATTAKVYLKEDFEDKFILAPESPSGLRWKTDRLTHPTKGYAVVHKDDIAGCKVKTSGYWKVGNKICHRIVYALVNGECPANLTVDHIDGNKDNNCITNLEVMSRNANSVKSHIGRKYKQGEDNYCSKLTNIQVLSMYKMFENNSTNDDIGEHYNVHPRYVSLIRHGKRWREMYLDYGVKFPESSKEISVTIEQMKKVLSMLDYQNKIISEVTGVEASTVSRIRSGKTLIKLRVIAEQQLQNERKYENITEV